MNVEYEMFRHNSNHWAPLEL